MSTTTTPTTADRLRALLNVGQEEWLTTESLAARYDFPTREAARLFVKRYVPFKMRGRRLVVDRRDFELVMRRKHPNPEWRKRRAAVTKEKAMTP